MIAFLSTEKDLDDFMRGLSPLKVRLNYTPIPAKDAYARSYQEDTDAIAAALASGSRMRLEGVMGALT